MSEEDLKGITCRTEAGPPVQIERFRGHPLIEDVDFFHAAAESSALAYVCRSGDTHYLAPKDVKTFRQIAGRDSLHGLDVHEDRLEALHRLGLLREEDQKSAPF